MKDYLDMNAPTRQTKSVGLVERPETNPPLLTVVVPTFNERENVFPIIERINSAMGGYRHEILFVDDASPDNTSDEVLRASATYPFVHLLSRTGRRGLSGACIEGILSAKTPYVAVLDGDMQHDEMILPKMLGQFEQNTSLDLVIGSRHVAGGSTGTGLSKIRKLGSEAFGWLTRLALGLRVTDPMSGFFMVKRSSFIAIATDLQSQGFKILTDILASSRNSWCVEELGYRFRSRKNGESKMDSAVSLELFALIVSHLAGGALPIRFVLFCMVGASGVFVQLLVLKMMMSMGGLAFAPAQVIGIAAAMTSNFVVNNLLTYRDRSLSGLALMGGLLKFYVVCSFGALINLAIAVSLHSDTQLWVLASALGALAGAVWNFVVSRLYTWKST